MFMEWNKKYELGIDVVDEQHKALFELVNTLHDSVVRGDEQHALAEILDELVEYTVEHFETEERKFEYYKYPKIEEHKKEHDDLVKQVVDLQTKFDNHDVTITYEVLDFLNDWLKEHTTNSDYEFAIFYNKK